MEVIQLRDRTFESYIDESAISERVATLAEEITGTSEDENPIFIGVLNGSFIFCADLLRNIHFQPQVAFIKLSSYQGTSSSGKVTEVFGLTQEITHRHVIVIEDIIDTGLSIHWLLKHLYGLQPASVKVCTLLFKPASLRYEMTPDFVGFEVEPKFLVGYGLDYDGYGRSLPSIYSEVSVT